VVDCKEAPAAQRAGGPQVGLCSDQESVRPQRAESGS
jgi:hypothetical protein